MVISFVCLSNCPVGGLWLYLKYAYLLTLLVIIGIVALYSMYMAKRGRKPKHSINWGNMGSMWRSIFALLLLVAGVIAFLSIFIGIGGHSGKLNSYLRVILIDTFGFLSIFLPFIIIYSAFLIIGTINFRFIKYKYLITAMILFLCAMGLFGSYAGNFGEILQNKVGEYISTVGAIVLFGAGFLITLFVVSNRGLDAWIKLFFGGIENLIHKLLRIKPPSLLPAGPDEAMEISDGSSYEPLSEAVVNKAKQYQLALDAVANASKNQDDSTNEFISPDINGRGADMAVEKNIQIIHPPNAPVGENDANNTLSESEPTGEKSQPTLLDETDHKVEKIGGLPLSNKMWSYPTTALLSNVPNQPANAGDVIDRARRIEQTLDSFGIKAKVVDTHVGPAVTQYAISIPEGSKAGKILNLSTDIALRIKSPSGSVRVEAPIPGSDWIGIEVPNYSPSTVSLKSVMESAQLKASKAKLSVAVGVDVSGRAVIEDMAKWPHALIAGSTGSGKSVMLNAIICSLLFRCSPNECKFIMIDPKMVEMVQYSGIPHLLTPVITDVEQKAVSALAWATSEMDRRYKKFNEVGVRNLEGYNALSGFQALPYIVIIIDELADMMMVASSDVERYITRLAQKSRATGIHLIIATQRPSVNVLTGTIKANIPTRIAFKVTSNVDSRVIIDQVGAETLVGRGDMLYVPPTDSKPRRMQGVYVADAEINNLVNFLKNSGVEPDYQEEILEQKVGALQKSGNGGVVGEIDDKMIEALEVVMQEGKASASYLQRKIGVGYARGARMIDDMFAVGIIGPANGSKPRDVLIASMDEALGRLKSGAS